EALRDERARLKEVALQRDIERRQIQILHPRLVIAAVPERVFKRVKEIERQHIRPGRGRTENQPLGDAPLRRFDAERLSLRRRRVFQLPLRFDLRLRPISQRLLLPIAQQPIHLQVRIAAIGVWRATATKTKKTNREDTKTRRDSRSPSISS